LFSQFVSQAARAWRAERSGNVDRASEDTACSMVTLRGRTAYARISCAQTHARTQQTHLPGRIGLPIYFALQFESVCVPVRGRLRLMLACVCVRACMHA
jgi:hypothetical protein